MLDLMLLNITKDIMAYTTSAPHIVPSLNLHTISPHCASVCLQVISYLQGQRARNEALSMLLEIELRHHRQTHQLLAAAQTQLSQWKGEADERVVRNDAW